MAWLARMPRGVVRAHLVMLDRLDAQESLVMAQRVMVGTGSYKGRTGPELMAEWSRVAKGEQEPDRQTATKPSRAGLGRLGLGVRPAAPKAKQKAKADG